MQPYFTSHHELLMTLYSVLTLLTILPTITSRPTSSTTTSPMTSQPSSDVNVNDTIPACTDICQMCLNLNFSSTNQWGTKFHDSTTQENEQIDLIDQYYNATHTETPAEDGGGTINMEDTQEKGRVRFVDEDSSRVGRRRRKEALTPTPCMQELLNHVTLLQEEMLRLDSRVSSMLGGLGVGDGTDESRIFGNSRGKQ